MRVAFIIVCLLSWVWPSFCQAEEPYIAVLQSILDADFKNDNPARWGKIYYPDGKGNIVGDCDCSEPRENFYLNYDTFDVVSSWKLGEPKLISKSKVKIPVQFVMLAHSRGRGNDRVFFPLHPPEEEVFIYDVWRIKGKWMVVDKNIPKTNLKLILDDISSNIKEYTTLTIKEPDRLYFKQSLNSYTNQLNALRTTDVYTDNIK
jgi:hypothetical protein